MAKKKMHITVTDMYCGAGGNSLGIRNLAHRYKGGLEVSLAMNHNELCIATHNTNFPNTHHICADIQNTNPRQVPSTDILIASPECTKHTNAEGKKRNNQLQPELWGADGPTEAEVRSRTTMMSVPEYSEYHGYNIVIVENVVEARYWVGWRSWLQYMFDLGYQHQVLYFNSMFFHPTPQSRDRMYVVFHKKGNKKPDLEFRPVAPCTHCGKNVEALQWFKPGGSEKAKYKSQYLYVCSVCAKVVTPYFYAAMNAIDWSLPGQRIGDRKKPLKDKTMERIRFGLQKYGGKPLSVRTAMGSGVDCRVRDLIGQPLDTQPGMSITGLVHPYLVDSGFGYGSAKQASGADEPLGTQTTAQTKGVVMPSPYLVETKYGHSGPDRSRAVDIPLSTQTGQHSMGMVTPAPMVVSTNYFDGITRKVDDPMPTQTSSNKLAIVSPYMLNMRGTSPDKIPHSTEGVDEPMGAQTTAVHHGLVSPVMVKLRGSGDDHVKKASSGIDEPLGTVSAGGNHHGMVASRAFVAPYYGSINANHVTGPMPTMATVEGHALVDGGTMNVDDLYFRMLKSHEIGRAMAFPDTYQVLGNERQRVKQYGNAVNPPVMEWIAERCIESLM